MGVEARFFVSNVGHAANGVGTISLQASTKGDYKSWSKFTPSGTVSLTCLNEAATAWFFARLGKDVAITFDDAPEVE
jgi:hypothetical protein